MKTTMVVSLEDLIRLISGYLGQKYSNQYKLKSQDFSFVVVDKDGNEFLHTYNDNNRPRLKQVTIEYDSAKND